MLQTRLLTPFSPRSRALAVPAARPWPLEPSARLAAFLMFRWRTSCICVFVMETVQHLSRDPNRSQTHCCPLSEPSVGASPTARPAPFSRGHCQSPVTSEGGTFLASQRGRGACAQQHVWLSLQPSHRADESREQPDLRSSLYPLRVQHVAVTPRCACAPGSGTSRETWHCCGDTQKEGRESRVLSQLVVACCGGGKGGVT